MKKSVSVLLSLLLVGLSAQAQAGGRDLRLLPRCEAKVREFVWKEYLKDDETASITGLKLLYGGSSGGLHYDAVVLVRTSDEIEPRDFLVVTAVKGSEHARTEGCEIILGRVLGDGSLPQVEGL
jgi:hypothetical protein